MQSHEELHFTLDEILRRFRQDTGRDGATFFKATIENLMTWSAETLDKPDSDKPQRALIAIEPTHDGKARVIAERGTNIPSSTPVGDMLGFLMDKARGRPS